MKSYKDLEVWQLSMLLVKEIYDICKLLPKEEIYTIGSQIKRSSISIPSNIAEGSRRYNIKEKKQFYKYAFSSGAEVETQLEIIKLLQLCDLTKINKSEKKLNSIMRMLNKLAY